MESQSNRVNLFWKIAVHDMTSLQGIQLPSSAQRLEEVSDPRVTLLFFGGRDLKTAADKKGWPLEQFREMHDALVVRAGEIASFTVDTIIVHPEVVWGRVCLPDGIACDRDWPYIKLRVSPGAPGSIVESLQHKILLTMLPDFFFTGQPADTTVLTKIEEIKLPEAMVLHGSIEMETGLPLGSQRKRGDRELRVVDQVQGRRVHVKKHSSMGAAQVYFPSPAVRDSVLDLCSGEPLRYRSISLDVQVHGEKLFDGSRKPVPNAIFVRWWQSAVDTINATELEVLFDEMVAPFMSSPSSHDDAGLADALLRNKADLATLQSIGTGSSAEDIVVLRLTRMAGSPRVISILFNHQALEPCRRQVNDAGCELSPSWANGAKLFVPLRKEQVEEASVVLKHYHIVAYSSDVEIVKAALAVMSCRDRPKLAHEKRMGKGKRTTPLYPEEPMLVVERAWRTNSSFGGHSSYGL